MIYLADQGDADREDNGCGILYGVLRDSAYKLKNLAEDEKANHIQKGWWPKKEWILKNDPPAAERIKDYHLAINQTRQIGGRNRWQI